MTNIAKEIYKIKAGQALETGVYFESEDKCAFACRKHSKPNKIHTELWSKEAPVLVSKFKKLPFIGEIFSMKEMFSGLNTAETKYMKFMYGTRNMPICHKMRKKESVFSIVISFFIIFSILGGLPFLLLSGVDYFIPMPKQIAFIVENILRVSLLVLSMELIKRDEERDVAKYHGAEHKCGNALEKMPQENFERDFNYDYVKNFSRIHYACGTNIVTITVFLFLVFTYFIPVYGLFYDFLLRVVFMPVSFFCSLEIDRFLKSFKLRKIMNFISVFQYLTTKEPTKEQLEVGVEAMRILILGKTGAFS